MTVFDPSNSAEKEARSIMTETQMLLIKNDLKRAKIQQQQLLDAEKKRDITLTYEDGGSETIEDIESVNPEGDFVAIYTREKDGNLSVRRIKNSFITDILEKFKD